jgi:Putative adhesin
VGHQRLATTSGTVRILDADGDVQAQTVSGSLVIRSAGELDLSARTVSGSADMSAARIRRLSLATTSGHLRLAGSLTGDGPFAMRTVSGDVEARLTGDVRVEARTLTGRIHSETQPESQPAARSGRRPVTIGNSGPVLSFESVSGGLWLAGPRPAPPMPPAAPSPPAPPTPPAHLAEEPGGQIPAAITREPGEDAAEGLDILRSLERGEIDVATALQRLEQLEREPETGNEPSESSFGGRT